jgi:radical SAM-linked protein
MQRLRVEFCRGEEIKFLSHLDLMRLWERALRRANLSLVYSEGFSPHARISLAAPLSVGVTSQAELMDVFLSGWISPYDFIDCLKPQLPMGLMLLDVQSIDLNEQSLQSQVSFAEYEVEVVMETEIQLVESKLKDFLSTNEIPWQHVRDTGVRNYDLRPLVEDLWLIVCHDSECVIGMRLRCGSSGTGRPEQVVKALGLSQHPKRIHRTKLILS